jgi:hypothetical protein
VYASEADPLYKALDAYEDAAGAVGVQTISTQGAYRQLTDAIAGHGDLQEARVSFALEATILAVLHDEWKAAGAALVAEVADGVAWQEWFATPRKRCANCGDAETWLDRFTGGTCSDCRSNAMEARDQAIVPTELISGCECDGEVGCSARDCSAKPIRPQRGHPDNIAHAEFIEDQAKAEDDLAARRAFYGS